MSWKNTGNPCVFGFWIFPPWVKSWHQARALLSITAMVLLATHVCRVTYQVRRTDRNLQIYQANAETEYRPTNIQRLAFVHILYNTIYYRSMVTFITSCCVVWNTHQRFTWQACVVCYVKHLPEIHMTSLCSPSHIDRCHQSTIHDHCSWTDTTLRLHNSLL